MYMFSFPTKTFLSQLAALRCLRVVNTSDYTTESSESKIGKTWAGSHFWDTDRALAVHAKSKSLSHNPRRSRTFARCFG